MTRQSIYNEIDGERNRQIQLHPDSNSLPDGTGFTMFKWARDVATVSCEKATNENRLTHRHVLEEEVYEALFETDQEKLRKELIQVAAVAVKWVEDIDRRALEDEQRQMMAK